VLTRASAGNCTCGSTDSLACSLTSRTPDPDQQPATAAIEEESKIRTAMA
jgi:hypothetical protein